MQVDQNDEDQPPRREFGVHPRRVRVNPIIDRCENELVDSGILGAKRWFDDLPFISYLESLVPSLLNDEQTRDYIILTITILILVISVIIIFPLLSRLGTTLFDIFGGEPLVPDIIG
jgi:hypothetical protein